MGKSIQFNLSGSTVSAELEKKITKEDLYGKVSVIAEKDSQPLQRCYLLPDGRIILRNQVSNAKTDPEGSLVEDPTYHLGELQLSPEDCSFDLARDMTAVDITALGAFSTTDVYGLSNPAGLCEGIYATSFSYRKGYKAWQDALVIVRSDAAFLLVGKSLAQPWMGRSNTYAFFESDDDTEESTDLLDFSAF
jgi:hypothetical protein